MVIITHGEKVLSSAPCDLAGLMDCTHEEADTSMFMHASDGAQHGMEKILLRTVDMDVVVISTSLAQKIDCECLCWCLVQSKHSGISMQQPWLKHLVMKNAWHFLHSTGLTGCDVTSSFAGKGKRTAWSAWNVFDDATTALCTLGQYTKCREYPECSSHN